MIGEEWYEELPDRYCPENKRGSTGNGPAGQLQCQKECEADPGCVGIAWTQNYRSICLLCQDDVLDDFDLNYGFYRRPQGNIKV